MFTLSPRAGVDQGCDLRHRARNPATFSGLRASRIVSEPPSGFVSDVAASGDEDHLVWS
jgi:hypothetical protein